MLGFMVLLSGCKRDGIHVYTVPKEKEVEVAEAGSEGQVAAPMIHYKTPAGWKDEGASEMRVAGFTIPDQKGSNISVSVVPLNARPSKIDLVNMWRKQVGLEPAREQDVDRDTQKVRIADHEAEMFDLVNEKGRVVVAMLPQGGMTWFFKMMGQDEAVQAEKPAFMEFLKSVEFHAGQTESSPGRFASTNAKRVPGGSTEFTPAAARPGWQVPPGWQEVPPTQMLLAKFVMPDKEQPKAEVTVSVFPGDAGGVLQNVNRWRRQIKLDPVQEGSLQDMTTSLDVPEGKAILVDLAGQNPTNGQPTRIIGAILPKGDRTWFYKLMGHEDIAEREKAAFIKFVQTATHPNG